MLLSVDPQKGTCVGGTVDARAAGWAEERKRRRLIVKRATWAKVKP